MKIILDGLQQNYGFPCLSLFEENSVYQNYAGSLKILKFAHGGDFGPQHMTLKSFKKI